MKYLDQILNHCQLNQHEDCWTPIVAAYFTMRCTCNCHGELDKTTEDKGELF